MLALAALAFGLSRIGGGIIWELPSTENPGSIVGFLFSLTILLGWLPLLAVGVYRLLRKQ
jgi:hypothetical protein